MEQTHVKQEKAVMKGGKVSGLLFSFLIQIATTQGGKVCSI